MKASRLAVLSLLFSLLSASAAFAADDGNTKPRLSTGAVSYGTSTADIIYQTSVSGNIKGASCHFINLSRGYLIFTVDGAAAQTIDVSSSIAFSDVDGILYTGWIPMNIRFGSSIRVQIQHAGNPGEAACTVSWALD